MSYEHVDVLIVGAGLSGIGAGCHLQANCPGKTYAILEARDCIGGTWDLFRYPGIRSDSDMFTLGYSFRPWKDAEAIADGAVGSALRAPDRRRASRRAEDSFSPSRGPRRVVERTSALDGRGRAQRHASDRAPELRLPAHVQRLLPLRRGLHAGLPRRRSLPRSDRASATLEQGHRLRGKARRRDRQRRDRGHARPRARARRRPRHDAAALAQLHPLAARARRARQPGAQAAAGQARLLGSALEERRDDDARLSAQPPPARAGEAHDSRGAREGTPGRIRHRHAFQAPLQPLGSAHVPGTRRGSVRGDPRRSRVGRHRPHRDVHRDRAAARIRRTSSRRIWS